MSNTNVLTYSVVNQPIFVQRKNRHLILQFALGCNMKCRFCNQRNYAKSSAFDTNKLITNIKKIEQYYSNKDQYLELALQGGELLQDKYQDSMFEQYQAVLGYCKAKLKPNIITLHTNLLHTKQDRVIKFCKENNIALAVSFDLADRFQSLYQLRRVYENIVYYIKHQIPVSIEIILTRANMQAFYQQTTIEYEIFEKIYTLTRAIHFQLYGSDNVEQDNNVVNENEIAEFFIWLDQYFPLCEDLQSFYLDEAHQTDCFKTIVSDQSIITTCCDPNRYKQFIKNHQCLSCIWYNKCQACACYRVLYNNKDCYQKRLFEYFNAKRRFKTTTPTS